MSGANRPKRCAAPKQSSNACEFFLAPYDLTPGPSPEGEGSSFAGIWAVFGIGELRETKAISLRRVLGSLNKVYYFALRFFIELTA